jgi:hypothetical protein
MTRRLTRREFLAFAGALAGAGAAGVVAATVGGRSGTLVTAPASTTTTTSTRPAVPAPVRAPTSTTGPPATAGAPAATAVPVLCRDAWGARPLQGDLVPHTIERMTVHHTAVRLDSNRDAPARARGHQRFHQDAGWPDLAYHYLVDANGHVYEGRPFTARGDTFTSYDPTGHFLVCCEGNFDEQDVPAAQFEALAAMLAWGSAEFGVAAATIGGHRDFAGTSCPGDRLAARLADGSLRARVEQILTGSGVVTESVCGGDGGDLVAAIEAGTDDTFTLTPPGFYLRHGNASGPADAVIPFGESDWLPVAGDTGG